MAGSGIAFLLFKFPPVLHIGIMYDDIGPHLRELANKDLRAAVACIPHIFPVRHAENGNSASGYNLSHVPQSVTHELRCVKGAGVIYIDSHGRNFKDVVFKPHQSVVSPDPQPAVLRKTIASDAGAGENYVGMRRPDPDGLQD